MSGKAALNEARARLDGAAGLPANDSKIMPLGPDRAVWYRLQLPPATITTPATLELPFPGMDSIELYRADSAGSWQVQRAGDAIAVDKWPVRYLYPVFTLAAQPGPAQFAYLRVQHSHPIAVGWVLRDASAFAESSKKWHLLLGAYLGFVALVILLSLANALLWRDAIHLYYAVHVILLALSLASLNGLAGEYLWAGNAWWNDIASVVIPTLSLGWLGLFVRRLVAEQGKFLVSAVLIGHTGICVLTAAGLLVLGRQHVFLFQNIYGALGLALILGVLAWQVPRRPRSGLLILAGVTALAVGVMFPILRNMGYMPVTMATQYGPQIGGALEIPLVLIGVYLRSRERRDHRVRMETLSHRIH